ncbi:MAG TPA: twin-arginine translocase TatA/TatE family subunit [Thermoanaerobaculia bacterium]|jgi:TatA/E family protein of Tat protein translocase
MGNLGMPELIMIMVLALLLFGPKKLPEIGKQVGKALGEFKRASNDLKRTIEDEMEKASSAVKIDDPPKDEPEKPAPALAPADGTISRPSETTKTPAP